MAITPSRSTQLAAAVQRLSLARDPKAVQEIVRTFARRLTGADGATLILREGDQCYYIDEDAIAPLWREQRFPMEHCVSGWVMHNRIAVAIPDIYADDRVPHEAYRPTFVHSLAMVPIRSADPVGAIGAYWADRHEASQEELATLQALADSTAVALENVRMSRELDSARLETLRRLAVAAELRDRATREHTERVALTAALIAGKLGLDPYEVAALRQAAPLHDIGKIAVSDVILLKPGRLTIDEFEEVKHHAEAGAHLLAGSGSKVVRTAHDIALTHHERWDGTGYPRGLAGEEIPIAGRIVALADVFDALTHERPYKDAWPVEEAVEEIHRLSGSHFDPAVVAAFAELDPAELADPTALRSS